MAGWSMMIAYGRVMMDVTERDFEPECEGLLNRFFDRYHNDAQRKRVLKALRFLMACDVPLRGKPAGWAGGIVYVVANRDGLVNCGVPGLLNRDLEEFFGVSMGTIRQRAAGIEALLDI